MKDIENIIFLELNMYVFVRNISSNVMQTNKIKNYDSIAFEKTFALLLPEENLRGKINIYTIYTYLLYSINAFLIKAYTLIKY